MLRLSGGQVESLFDEALPVEVRELPEDLAALDTASTSSRAWRLCITSRSPTRSGEPWRRW
jgi:hypothetical protein